MLYPSLRLLDPRIAERDELESFHHPDYVEFVIRKSAEGRGFLDAGDTPAFHGVLRVCGKVVGATVRRSRRSSAAGRVARSFRSRGCTMPRVHSAAGFCVFNDCGSRDRGCYASDTGCERIAYVDIDAHHGDGVFYSFESDPMRSSSTCTRTGVSCIRERVVAVRRAAARPGTKLNIPLPPGADDAVFLVAWVQDRSVPATAPA